MSKTHLKHRLTEKLRDMLWFKLIHVRNRGSWVICPYSSGLLRWDQGSHKIAPVPMKCPCRIWINHIDSPETDSTTTAKYKLKIYFGHHTQKNVLNITVGIHLWPTSNWPVMLWDQLATDLWPVRDRLLLPAWLGKSLHELDICNWFTTMPNDIRGHWVNYDQPSRLLTKGGSSCELAHLQVKFHDCFSWLKVVLELVDFNGK